MFAKALQKLGINERKAVNISGFNAPEWTIAFIGSICNNNIGCGVYTTNSPEQCLFLADNSEAEIIVLDSVEQLVKYNSLIDKLPKVKAFVMYWEDKIPSNLKLERKVYLWNDFLQLGRDLSDEVVFDRMNR